MSKPIFEEYLKSLSAVDPQAVAADPEILQLCVSATAAIASLESIDQKSLACLVQSDPTISRVLATVVGLSQERFKTWLMGRFSTAGWVILSRERSAELISALDQDFHLVSLLNEQRNREWTWADVLARAMAPLQRASSSIRQGRNLEDQVEEVIQRAGRLCACGLQHPCWWRGCPRCNRSKGVRLNWKQADRCSPRDRGDGEGTNFQPVHLRNRGWSRVGQATERPKTDPCPMGAP